METLPLDIQKRIIALDAKREEVDRLSVDLLERIETLFNKFPLNETEDKEYISSQVKLATHKSEELSKLVEENGIESNAIEQSILALN